MPALEIKARLPDANPPGDGPTLAAAEKLLIEEQVLARKDIYLSIARRAGFSLKFGEQTAFDHETNTAVISISQLFDMGMTSAAAIDFAILHELGHYAELFDDPQGYKAVIDSSNEPCGSAIFHLYNCLMDIYVNCNTANRAPVYRRGEGFSPEVHQYYRQGAFPDRDFSKKPLCFQFADYLLNLGMQTADDITLAPQVRAVVDGGVQYMGQHYSFEQLISQFLRPALGVSEKDFWQATISQRKAVIDATIRPTFEALMRQDIASGREQEIQAAAKKNKTSPSPDNLKRALRAAEAVYAEKNMSPEDKAERQRSKQLSQIGEQAQLAPQQVEDFTRRYGRVQPIVNQLLAVWNKVRIPSVEWEITTDDLHYKTGTALDVQRAINLFPEIQSDPAAVNLMHRRRFSEQQIVRPKEIRLWLVIDCSGSMDDDMTLVQDLSIALSASMAGKNEQAVIKGDPIKCSLGIIGFNAESTEILPMTNDITIAAIMRAYSCLKADGSTADHTALERIRDSLTEEHKKALSVGDYLEMVIEITDGETSDGRRSYEAISALEKAGILCGAIRLSRWARPDAAPEQPAAPDSTQPAASQTPEIKEGVLFEEVWNADGKRRGRRIGSSRQLPQAVQDMLKDYTKEPE